MISQRERMIKLLKLSEFGFNGKVINSINISHLFDGKMISREREWD